MRAAALLTVTVTGCPGSRAPAPAPASATVAPASTTPSGTAAGTGAPPEPDHAEPLAGRWTVLVVSTNAGLNPDMFDTPELKAKVFFDHEATLADGRVQVAHRTLDKSWPVKDESSRGRMNALVRDTDWAALKERVAAESPTEGGTTFTVTITVGDAPPLELTTTSIDSHAPLAELVEAMRSVAGVPGRR